MAVYMIREGDSGPVKIGSAKDVQIRLVALRTGNSRPLNILRVLDGGRPEEALLHAHYAARRLQGEWFSYCPTMLEIEFSSVVATNKIPYIVGLEDDKIFKPLPAQSRCARAWLGWSLREFAKKANLSPNTLLAFENERIVSRNTVRVVAAVFYAAGIRFSQEGQTYTVTVPSGDSVTGVKDKEP